MISTHASSERRNMKRYMQKLKRNAKGQSAKLRQCYVYEIRVDGVVRYIGKGCDDRIYSCLLYTSPSPRDS